MIPYSDEIMNHDYIGSFSNAKWAKNFTFRQDGGLCHMNSVKSGGFHEIPEIWNLVDFTWNPADFHTKYRLPGIVRPMFLGMFRPYFCHLCFKLNIVQLSYSEINTFCINAHYLSPCITQRLNGSWFMPRIKQNINLSILSFNLNLLCLIK